MGVQRMQLTNEHDFSFELLDDDNQLIPIVSGFMSHLYARGFSPNTQAAYAYDLLHFMSFLKQQRLTYLEFTPIHPLHLFPYLPALPTPTPHDRLRISLFTPQPVT